MSDKIEGEKKVKGRGGVRKGQELRAYSAEEKALVVMERAKGKSYRKIGEMLGRPRSSVYGQVGRENMRELIEAETLKLMEAGLAPARRTLVRIAEAGNDMDLTAANAAMLKLSLDASRSIVTAATAAGPGTVVNSFMQINNNTSERSAELRALQGFLAERWGFKVEDAGGVVEAEVEG
jgi:hypothetical protein